MRAVYLSLKQHGDGPTLGLWQVETATHDDLYTNFLNFWPELGSKLMQLRVVGLSLGENLSTKLMYDVVVCRLCYYRKPYVLPEAGNVEG